MKYIVHIVFLVAMIIFSTPDFVFSSQEAAYRFNEQGLEKLRNRDFEGAINDFKQAHLYMPSNQSIRKNLAAAYNNYGFYLMQRGDIKYAIEKLESSIYYDSENVYAFYNLGQAYYRIQNMPKAREYLRKAYYKNPDVKGLKALLDKVEKEEGVEKRFEKLETMHFIVASAPDVTITNLSYIRTYLEEAYGRIGMFLDYYPVEKTITVLYSADNYGKLLEGKPHWAMAFYDGKVRIPVNKFQYADEDVIKIIYHEYAHVLINNITSGRCPLWLSEGIASWVEDFVSERKKSLYKTYIERFGLVSLSSIPDDFTKTNDAMRATLMYIESYTVVDYMIKRVGNKGIRELLSFLGQGINIKNAIEKVFDDRFDKFQKKWEKYLVGEYGISNLRFQ